MNDATQHYHWAAPLGIAMIVFLAWMWVKVIKENKTKQRVQRDAPLDLTGWSRGKVIK